MRIRRIIMNYFVELGQASELTMGTSGIASEEGIRPIGDGCRDF